MSVIAVAGKKAVSTWKPFMVACPSENDLVNMFASPRVTGLAVICGEVSRNLVIRDFDAEGTYDAWREEHRALAKSLPTVRTSRGHHVYGRDQRIDRVSKLPDGEVRAGGGYCLAPPSRHPSGVLYRWLIPPGKDIPEVPFAEVGLVPPFGTQTTQTTQTTQDVWEGGGGGTIQGDSRKVGGDGRKGEQQKSSSKKFDSEILEAILATQPSGEGQRHNKLFELARWLKSIPGIGDEPALMREIIREWHRRALQVIRTKDFDTTWSNFRDAWEHVRFARGRSLECIAQEARERPLPKAAYLYDTEPRQLLVALCAALQENAGAQAFPLACRDAARLIGVSKSEAARMLKDLQFDQVITLQKPGVRGANSGEASEWRFIGGNQ